MRCENKRNRLFLLTPFASLPNLLIIKVLEIDMKIKEIEIRSLFGYFDHRIPLKTDDRITIIHGPNGVGKTTVLRLISDLFEGRFHSLLDTPFDRIVVRFKPKGSLTVIPTKEKGAKDFARLELIYRFGKERIEHTVWSLRGQKRLGRLPSSLLERQIDDMEGIERVGLSEWRDVITGELLSFNDFSFHHEHFLPPDIRESIISVPEQIESLLKQINIVVVETQRLFTGHEDAREERTFRYKEGEVPVQRMTVEQYSEDMVSRIESYQRKSGELGASLDSSFPQRLLLDSKLPKIATENHIKKEYTAQSKYRDRLMKASLLVAETPVPLSSESLKEHERKVLWAYLNDVKKKLQVFDPLLRRVELFKDIVNSRFSYKKFAVDKDKGFIFESDHDGSIVPPRALSSGEQHEIVLTYELLFKAKPGSMIFIDEPELSLHVTWQRKFLEDIAKIAQLADIDFLVATHSPSIIHNRRDLMVELAGGGKSK